VISERSRTRPVPRHAAHGDSGISPTPFALRAGPHVHKRSEHRELAILDAAGSAAGGTGSKSGTRRKPASSAMAAGLIAGDGGAEGRTEGRILEGDPHPVLQILAAAGARYRSGSPSLAEKEVEDLIEGRGAEELLEGLAGAAEPLRPEIHALLRAHMAEAVVLGALHRVGEDFVGLRDFAELPLRLLFVALVHVGVVLFGQAAEGPLDLLLGGVSGYAQDLVVVLRHRGSPGDPFSGPAVEFRRHLACDLLQLLHGRADGSRVIAGYLLPEVPDRLFDAAALLGLDLFAQLP
jgi:hypothetical protein